MLSIVEVVYLEEALPFTTLSPGPGETPNRRPWMQVLGDDTLRHCCSMPMEGLFRISLRDRLRPGEALDSSSGLFQVDLPPLRQDLSKVHSYVRRPAHEIVQRAGTAL